MRITFLQLLRAGACGPARDEFEARFGKGVEVTSELCESVAERFDWVWAGSNLLHNPGRRHFFNVVGEALRAPSERDYHKVLAKAFAEGYNMTSEEDIQWSPKSRLPR